MVVGRSRHLLWQYAFFSVKTVAAKHVNGSGGIYVDVKEKGKKDHASIFGSNEFSPFHEQIAVYWSAHVDYVTFVPINKKQ